jgi:hypothetical protein
MSRIRTIMLSLLAVFALGAVASASASAAEKPPEFKSASEECVKISTLTGRYTNATCTTESATHEGEFDLIPKKHKFTSISEPSYLFANATGSFRIRCGKDTDKGEFTSAKTVGNVTVTFEECKGFKGTEECSVKSTVPVGPAGTIITNTLSGELGTVAAAEAPDSEVGLDLKATTGASFVKLAGTPETCVPETNVTGSVIGEVEPVKIMDTTGELIFSVFGGLGKHNKQGIQKIGSAAKDTLTAFALEAGFESEDSLFYEENIEVT